MIRKKERATRRASLAIDRSALGYTRTGAHTKCSLWSICYLPRVVFSFGGAPTRRVARLGSNWPPRWGPTPHSVSTGRRFCDPPPPAAPRMPLDVLRSPLPSLPPFAIPRAWSRLNALASLCCVPPVPLSRSRACSLFANPSSFSFSSSYHRFLTRARKFSLVIVNERAIDDDRFASRRLACRLYSRLTA